MTDRPGTTKLEKFSISLPQNPAVLFFDIATQTLGGFSPENGALFRRGTGGAEALKPAEKTVATDPRQRYNATNQRGEKTLPARTGHGMPGLAGSVRLTTYIDKGHIQNHLDFKAVNFTDHKLYHANKHDCHEIRQSSGQLCREYGLSVIVPCRDKGKSCIEHQAVQNDTSYKAELKCAIEPQITVSFSMIDLLDCLQRKGCENKRGKYISARVPDQVRFTQLKILGADYTKKAVHSRIAGGPRSSSQL